MYNNISQDEFFGLILMLINQCPAFFISSSSVKKNINNNKQLKLDIISLKPLNKLIIKIAIAQLSPFPRPSTRLQGKQMFMYIFFCPINNL